MAKLYFRYGAMNSGKSTAIMQVAHNYEEQGLRVFLIKPKLDTKMKGSVVSRLGLSREADFLSEPGDELGSLLLRENQRERLACVLVDEAQFLTVEQVDELFALVVLHGIPVICYGLRTDFMAEGFPASSRLLLLAHSIEELKTICRCGRKAILNARMVDGKFVFTGDQVAIDQENNVSYESMCGACYFEHRARAIEDSKINGE